MPQFFIEAPAGIGSDAKRTLMREVTDAIDEAFHMRPDIQVWLREHADDNVAYDGRLNDGPMRVVGFLEAPEHGDVDAKRTMSNKIIAAIAQAYRGIANTEETLILMNHYPLENAGVPNQLQSDNPHVVAAIQQLRAA